MALTLQSLLPPTRSGRTFFVASCVLGFGAAAQLLVMGIFLLRGGAAHHAAAAPTIAFAETMQPGVVETPAPQMPQAAPPTPATVNPAQDNSTVPLPEGGLARPTPATAPPAGNSVAELIDQSRQLRQRGDMPSALARLREAQVAEPENAQIVAEMALTYEAMQLPDRAFEQWQRLYDMGESVGALHYLADSRLHTAPPSAPGNAAPESAPPATGTQVIPGSALDALQGSTVLKITDLHQEDVPDPSADKKLVLRIVVKDRPGSAIDPTKVRILTYFYDLIDGNDIVLTDAQTDFAWVTPAPINWAGDKSEVLETTYFRAKAAPAAPPSSPAASAAPSPAGRASRRGGRGGRSGEAAPVAPSTPPPAAPVRTYLGYVVRLYYDRQLQDVQADPVRLLQKFPPPLTLPAE